MMIKAALLLCLVAVSFKSSNADFQCDIPAALERFTQLDTDKDQSISYDEFKKATFYKRAPADEKEWNALFDVIDTSENQSINKREFVIAETLHQEFNSYDTGVKDGMLDDEELMKLIDISNSLVPGSASWLEYFAHIITDEKLSEDWKSTVGKAVN